MTDDSAARAPQSYDHVRVDSGPIRMYDQHGRPVGWPTEKRSWLARHKVRSGRFRAYLRGAASVLDLSGGRSQQRKK